jgi:hypothetical protein
MSIILAIITGYISVMLFLLSFLQAARNMNRAPEARERHSNWILLTFTLSIAFGTLTIWLIRTSF